MIVFHISLVLKEKPSRTVTNILKATKTAKDPDLQSKIEELNESYNKLRNLKDTLEVNFK